MMPAQKWQRIPLLFDVWEEHSGYLGGFQRCGGDRGQVGDMIQIGIDEQRAHTPRQLLLAGVPKKGVKTHIDSTGYGGRCLPFQLGFRWGM